MKYAFILIFAGLFLVVPSAVEACACNYYPSADGETPLQYGDCILVNDLASADSTYVYTLNPDHTGQLYQAYQQYWSRGARCDELQFHVDHATSLSRLKSWLSETAIGWYQNIGTSHFEGQTLSTLEYEWFFIKDGVARRIPDILTAWSWGLMIGDRISIPTIMGNSFYDHVTIGAPINFSDGPYADKVHSIWKEEDRDYSTLPDRLADKIDWFEKGNPPYAYSVFEKCVFQWPGGVWISNPYRNLLNWSWMQYNPECVLAS